MRVNESCLLCAILCACSAARRASQLQSDCMQQTTLLYGARRGYQPAPSQGRYCMCLQPFTLQRCPLRFRNSKGLAIPKKSIRPLNLPKLWEVASFLSGSQLLCQDGLNCDAAGTGGGISADDPAAAPLPPLQCPPAVVCTCAEDRVSRYTPGQGRHLCPQTSAAHSPPGLHEPLTAFPFASTLHPARVPLAVLLSVTGAGLWLCSITPSAEARVAVRAVQHKHSPHGGKPVQ